jgi:Ca2+-binding RTX toxin-like protein
MALRPLRRDNNRKMRSSLFLGIGITCSVLLFASSIIFLGVDKNAWALIRGTPYDDLLTSDMNNNNNNNTSQADLMAGTEATGAEQGPNAANSEFIYGDYGNDEIQGYDKSDHLSGGPGSDIIYGNSGGDFIEGGLGIDSLYGGAGDDVLSGGEGADYFDCGLGRDSIDDFNSTEGDYALSNCEILENEEAPSQ